MAKKKRKRRPQNRPPQTTAAQEDERGATKPAPAARKAPPRRREHKEEARKARERALRQYRRRRALRRALIVVGTVLAIAAAIFLIGRFTAVETQLPEEARELARAAGCSLVQQQEDRGRQHLDPGQPYTYPDAPATSGPHDRDGRVSAGVYEEPLDETLAVHSLEHAYVIAYYRSGEDGLPEPVVEALSEQLRGEEKVVVAPHPTLPEGTDLAFAAWRRLMTCPGSIEPEQATELANEFVEVFRGSQNAPEPNSP